ncbi:MAG: TIGR03086 family metal-binding protein [Ardenticatenales bacterium]
MDLTEPFRNAFDFVARTVAGVNPDQLSRPTPCTEWDVRALAEHLVNGQLRLTAVAAGDAAMPEPITMDDPAAAAAAIRATAPRAAATWAAPDALDRTLTVPWGTSTGRAIRDIQFLELCSHGWDLARATDQPTDLDDATVGVAFEIVRGRLTDDRRGGAFKPAQPVAADAPAFDQLLAFMGRTV